MGTAVALKGADKTFTTQEDNSEDEFIPIRTERLCENRGRWPALTE